MKVLIFLQLVILFAATVSTGPVKSTDEDTLVLLHVLFRHGNRTPDKGSLFPKDIHVNETYAPFGLSQLTVKGKKTEYNIGKYLRETYGKLIPEQYTKDVVYAVVTNFKRTKMSLELVLASLFLPDPSNRFDRDLPWQPIPFNVEPGQGIITTASSSCASYISSYYTYVLSQDAEDAIVGYKNLYKTLSTNTGSDVKRPSDVLNIYFALKSEEDYGFRLPKWTAGIYPQIMEEAGAVDYEFSTANSNLKKFSAGFLLKKILQDSVAKKDGLLTNERKVFLYSAHEYNVATMLRTLNVFYRHVPPFGATIFFEIHNIQGNYGLKLLYQDYTEENPKVLTIPGCSKICPLDKLYELVAESIPGENDVCVNSNEIM